MTVRELCEKIDMPDEVTKSVCADTPDSDGDARRLMCALCGAGTYAAAYEEAKHRLAPDPDGIRMLRLMLWAAATETKKRYDETGIDVHVFFDTVACFSRFVREYREAYGSYGFDRGWWTGRQLSLRLVRLGTLEYEFAERDGQKAIFLHIPSDADLSQDKTAASVRSAREFAGTFFPAYADCDMVCESWLLSPALAKLLPPSSRILRFAACFDVVAVDPDARDYVRWVYRVPDLAPENFCGNTMLQRNIKQYVLSGGKIGNAAGVWKRDTFGV